jgi:synaptic vesicle membrane protein VAT-1
MHDYGVHAIDHGTEDFVVRVAAAGGVDAVFDPIGGAHWLRSYRCLRPQSHLVMY